jgi:hypothetical protein
MEFLVWTAASFQEITNQRGGGPRHPLNASRSDSGWRLPAAEIERSVRSAEIVMLEDQSAVLAAITEARIASSEIQSVLETA